MSLKKDKCHHSKENLCRICEVERELRVHLKKYVYLEKTTTSNQSFVVFDKNNNELGVITSNSKRFASTNEIFDKVKEILEGNYVSSVEKGNKRRSSGI